jgi:uncharacterized protein (TIGR02217 family)
MAFHDVRFPVDISYGSTGGPNYSTDIVTTFSGHEQRNINWGQARARYNVAHGVKTQTQLDALIAFFRTRKGRAHSFRFKDWTDYEAATQLIGTGNGSIKDFQLIKQYVSGSIGENRTITKPVTGTVQVYLNGVLQVSGYTLNAATGVVSFATAPANGVAVTASFQFDVPVRFDTDQLSARLENYGVRSWQDIPLVEVRG